eukprot:CAMPEP_0171299728 /NCGR_PEP_ID=MMETSP0816-20121228/8590_1 /TAXON_ID=420281 /ORGANISM="Proboscia inermis, Strain CCAP1064/1" /LENGTH=58 /DNA_ID=CAMNT_0011775769 /DNA_START=38 /DNA_END=214 /DNA_ORIENTATION=-
MTRNYPGVGRDQCEPRAFGRSTDILSKTIKKKMKFGLDNRLGCWVSNFSEVYGWVVMA